MRNVRGSLVGVALVWVACAGEPDAGPRTDTLELARTLAHGAGWTALDAEVSAFIDDGHALRASGALPAELPLRADAPMIFGDGELGLRMLGASDAPGALEEGVLVFPDAHAATDTLVVHDGSKLEVLYLLADRSAPREWRWRMERTAELAPAALEGTTVVLADATGAARYRIHAPGAVDARGERLAVTTALEDDTIVFTLEDRAGAAFPILVDPIVETTDWVRRLDRSTAGYVTNNGGVAYDGARQQLVVFGGREYRGYVARLDDLLLWDGTTWTYVPRSTPWPQARSSAAMVYDPVRARVVLLFGDATTDTQTWEWDGARWWSVSTTEVPAARQGVAAAWDPRSSRVVIFGGSSSSYARLAETWSYDGAVWTRAMPAMSPSARTDAALGCTTTHCVLFGGIDASSTLLGDTWVWNGSTWSSVPTPGGPSARYGGAIGYDPVRDRLVLYGGGTFDSVAPTLGDAWEWTGSGWTRLTPAPPPGLGISSPTMVYDSRAGALLVTPPSGGGLAERWWFDGTSWRSASSLPPASDSSAVYDEARQRTLLFGSVPGTFEWDGTTLARRMLDPQPVFGSPRAAYDARRAVTVLVGVNSADAAETWTFDGTAWTLRAGPMPGPRVVETSAITYDRGRERVVLLGGTPWASTPGPMETWEWDGTAWSLRTPTSTPSPRDAHQLAYDESRGYVILFGGMSPSYARLCETWLYDGTRWTPLSPTTSPSGCDAHRMVYDPGRARVLHFGGYGPRGYYGGTDSLSDLYAFDGSDWSLVTVDNPGPDRGYAGVAFDRDRDRLVAWGGRRAVLYDSYSMSELWELGRSRARGSECTDGRECGSGFCVDGVCCDSACGAGAIDDCQACSMAFGGASDGTCGPLTAAFAPSVTCRASAGACDEPEVCAESSAECPTDAARAEGTPCGAAPALACDAQDVCEGSVGASAICVARYAEAGVVCSVAACTDGVETSAATCSGDAAECDGAAPRPCAPYLCGATQCLTTCASGADCDGTSQCVGGACVGRLELGDACVADGQCVSGACVDGHCCSSRCDGQCEACDIAGAEGTCGPIAGAPHGTRAACGGDGSECSGACDGVERTSCSYPASGTSCGGARCDGTVAHEGPRCDGAGACLAGAVSDCAPFVCSSGACRRSCVDDSACAPGARCEGGSCVTPAAMTDAGADASTHDDAGHADAGVTPMAGGCGCRATSSVHSPSAVGLAALVALALVPRRRQSGASASRGKHKR